MSKTPVILKKNDSLRPSRQAQQSIQPKILTKASTVKEKENAQPVQIIKPVKALEIENCPQPQMTQTLRIIHPHFQVDQKFFDFLDNENTDFLVVGVIGAKHVGKSTLLNIIAHQDYLKFSQDASSISFQTENEIFSTSGATGGSEGVTIDFFATLDRIILLDCSPVLFQRSSRDMIVVECDDLKLSSMLIQLCHLVLVVGQGFPDLSCIRLLNLADQMNANVKHRPVFYHILNRVQPGTKVLQLDKRIQENDTIIMPDLMHSSMSLHYDLQEIIQNYQEKVFMMKRWSMESDVDVFTEKKWGQRFVNVLEQMKNNDYFLRKYEGLRDKFHQPIENC